MKTFEEFIFGGPCFFLLVALLSYIYILAEGLGKKGSECFRGFGGTNLKVSKHLDEYSNG